jgi:hypothetical protein
MATQGQDENFGLSSLAGRRVLIAWISLLADERHPDRHQHAARQSPAVRGV